MIHDKVVIDSDGEISKGKNIWRPTIDMIRWQIQAEEDARILQILDDIAKSGNIDI